MTHRDARSSMCVALLWGRAVVGTSLLSRRPTDSRSQTAHTRCAHGLERIASWPRRGQAGLTLGNSPSWTCGSTTHSPRAATCGECRTARARRTQQARHLAAWCARKAPRVIAVNMMKRLKLMNEVKTPVHALRAGAAQPQRACAHLSTPICTYPLLSIPTRSNWPLIASTAIMTLCPLASSSAGVTRSR